MSTGTKYPKWGRPTDDEGEWIPEEQEGRVITSPSQEPPSPPTLDIRNLPPLEMMTPIQTVISRCDDEDISRWLESYNTGNVIESWLAAAVAAQHLTLPGLIGTVQLATTLKDAIHYLVELNNTMSPATRFISWFGSIQPFPLFEMDASAQWLKENKPEAYAECREQGMYVPAAFFDQRLSKDEERFIVLAGGDIRTALTDTNYRSARYMIQSLVGAGCSILIFYRDQDSLDVLTSRKIFSQLRIFPLGQF